VTLGRRTTIRQRETTLEGLAEDVDDDGALLLRLDDGRRMTILWGDVE
jgi:BirA family transcriptional regulator, biotin operon repressor / biotin---[acetyl-CoA-carboxylase] ligase